MEEEEESFTLDTGGLKYKKSKGKRRAYLVPSPPLRVLPLVPSPPQ
jgi:hypothetical protein